MDNFLDFFLASQKSNSASKRSKKQSKFPDAGREPVE